MLIHPQLMMRITCHASSKAKVPHISRVEGKGILWHAFPLPLLLSVGQGERKQIGRHLERLNKETDQHLYLVPACHTEETSREECSMVSCNKHDTLPWTLRCRRSLSLNQGTLLFLRTSIQFKIKAVENQQVRQNTCRSIHY